MCKLGHIIHSNIIKKIDSCSWLEEVVEVAHFLVPCTDLVKLFLHSFMYSLMNEKFLFANVSRSQLTNI